VTGDESGNVKETLRNVKTVKLKKKIRMVKRERN
jgi:hypothetical protein